MNKKEQYDKKIEIIKKFLEVDGDIGELIKIQNDNVFYDRIIPAEVNKETKNNTNRN